MDERSDHLAKSLIFRSEDKVDALKALEELWVASSGSEPVAEALACDSNALRMFLQICAIQDKRDQSSGTIAAGILVNVSSLPLGASRLLVLGALPALSNHVYTHKADSNDSAIRSTACHLRTLANLLRLEQARLLALDSHTAKGIVMAVALCPSREDVREYGAAALTNMAADDAGVKAIVNCKAHRLLFNLLFPASWSMNKYIQHFVHAARAQPASPTQLQALHGIRNITSTSWGKRVFVTEIPASVAVVSTFLHSDTLAAVEHAASITANLLQMTDARAMAEHTGVVSRLRHVLNASVYIKPWRAPDFAVASLINIAMTENGRTSMLDQDLHLTLAGLLSSTRAACSREAVLTALANLAISPPACRAMALSTVAQECATKSLAEGSAEEQHAACGLLRNLAMSDAFKLAGPPESLRLLADTILRHAQGSDDSAGKARAGTRDEKQSLRTQSGHAVALPAAPADPAPRRASWAATPLQPAPTQGRPRTQEREGEAGAGGRPAESASTAAGPAASVGPSPSTAGASVAGISGDRGAGAGSLLEQAVAAVRNAAAMQPGGPNALLTIDQSDRMGGRGAGVVAALVAMLDRGGSVALHACGALGNVAASGLEGRAACRRVRAADHIAALLAEPQTQRFTETCLNTIQCMMGEEEGNQFLFERLKDAKVHPSTLGLDGKAISSVDSPRIQGIDTIRRVSLA